MAARRLAHARAIQNIFAQKLPAAQHHHLDGAHQNSFDIGVRHPSEPIEEVVSFEAEIRADRTQFDLKQVSNLSPCGPIKEQDLIESPPKGSVEEPLVVRCCDEQAWTSVSVQELEERVDDPTQLTVLARILPLFSESIEFVEQHDEAIGRDEIKDLAQIGRCLAKK